ncbi:T-cell surface glycoprotein CD3 epsilon chain-like [Gambusia affinis]|uniref:T-cell surface glycoprotein CD3 epsilon chain-like n=1 Tax=Gambusia affinis TaxID=33528 RepID=UPI000F3A05D9|nr:T-cell surface glycoprotein CD3 epsilon chain-like [Gambusia affinis]
MAAQAVFVVIFMFATSVKAETGGATFWREDVTLTCPESHGMTWYNEKSTQETSPLAVNQPNEFKFRYERPVQYRCQHKNNDQDPKTMNYHFYIKGKACKNCFELGPMFFLTFIVVNVIGTAVLMMIVYKCSKKKNSDGQTSSIKLTPRPGPRAPHGASTEYETLNPNTRSQDTYSTVVNSGLVNRTG